MRSKPFSRSMGRFCGSGVGLVAALWLTAWDVAAATEEQPAPLRIEVVSPSPGELVKNTVDLAPVRGSAQSGSGDPKDFDVFVAIDVSYSTRFPSGIDIDEDGEVGFNPERELVAPGPPAAETG